MKPLFLFLTLILLLLVINSCSHDLERPAEKVVKGDWQWEYSVGGVGGDSLAPMDNTLITLSLNKDSTYVFYLNNALLDSGSYSIQGTANTAVLHLARGISIGRLSMDPEQLILKWDSSQLQLLDSDISDGFNHHFKKAN